MSIVNVVICLLIVYSLPLLSLVLANVSVLLIHTVGPAPLVDLAFSAIVGSKGILSIFGSVIVPATTSYCVSPLRRGARLPPDTQRLLWVIIPLIVLTWIANTVTSQNLDNLVAATNQDSQVPIKNILENFISPDTYILGFVSYIAIILGISLSPTRSHK